ncbi:LysR family transcriptional regulator [Alteromonas mediterranea MED64]|uniref:LysR family transcriptional regulator n=1 Tax=Alteromonas mediterranea TaxID=314275 RepID=UPI0003555866|nr:LysR family transcriptional regulator [Alteromonas mediterranea]AGP83166.1 LysR family transcriptional regulator [Alteromonas mediterranea MED64]
MINPIWLDTFITLVETGNFTRTAEQRFMTQPGVSQHIKKLEDVCNCELVIRLGKGIQLTEQGQRVYHYAKSQQAQEQDFIASLKFDAPYEGKCVVACSGAIAQRIYPALLSLQKQHSALNIHVEVAPRRTILSGIANNTLELGIVTNMPDTEDVQSEYLGEEPLGLILPRALLGSDLATSDNAKSADVGLQKADGSIKNVVTTLGLINHPDAMHYVQRYFNDCGEADLASINPNQLHHTGYINQLSQILLPVSEGLGFTVLPTSTLNFVSFAEKLAVYQAKNDVTEPLYSVQTPHSALPARYEIVKKKISQVLGPDSDPTIRN